MSLGRTAKYYKENPKARNKKAAYDKKFQKEKSKLRSESSATNGTGVMERKVTTWIALINQTEP